MKGLADAVIALLNLLEAEGRDLKRNIFRVAVSVTLVAIAGAMVVLGVGFISAAVFLLIEQIVYKITGFDQPVTAAALTGIMVIGMGGGTLWLAWNNLNLPK